MTPAFDTPVCEGGYVWWYLDALSDDGRHGLTMIAFIGSVFSPYYARARRRGHGRANPLNHCAFNLAFYSTGGSQGPGRWAMTERGADQVDRSANRLRIGPSAVEWDGSALCLHIDEWSAPLPGKLRGTVRLQPDALHSGSYALDPAGRHHWSPIAPHARVDVVMDRPDLRWQGTGYLDSNRGDRPLEQDFSGWQWSRAALAGCRSAVLYDVVHADAGSLSLALEFDRAGQARPFTPPVPRSMPATAWRMARSSRSEGPQAPRVVQTLEDGPFYARSLLRMRLLGEEVQTMHESLSMARWAKPVVQLMLPFRMPRRG